MDKTEGKKLTKEELDTVSQIKSRVEECYNQPEYSAIQENLFNAYEVNVLLNKITALEGEVEEEGIKKRIRSISRSQNDKLSIRVDELQTILQEKSGEIEELNKTGEVVTGGLLRANTLLKEQKGEIERLEGGSKEDCPFSLKVGSEVTEQKSGRKYILTCPLQTCVLELKQDVDRLQKADNDTAIQYRKMWTRKGIEITALKQKVKDKDMDLIASEQKVEDVQKEKEYLTDTMPSQYKALAEKNLKLLADIKEWRVSNDKWAARAEKAEGQLWKIHKILENPSKQACTEGEGVHNSDAIGGFCTKCGGLHDDDKKPCSDCGGKKWTWQQRDGYRVTDVCETCHGTREVDNAPK